MSYYPLRTHSSLRGTENNTVTVPLQRFNSFEKPASGTLQRCDSSTGATGCTTQAPFYASQFFGQNAYQQPFPFAQPYYGGYYAQQQQPQFSGGFYPAQQQQQQPYYYAQQLQQGQQPYIYYGSQQYSFPHVTTVTPAPTQPVSHLPYPTQVYTGGSVTLPQTQPAAAPAPAPVTVPASSGSSTITNPLNNSTQPKDNPLNWGMYTQEKSALYPSAPIDNPNTNFRSLAIGINNTGILTGQNFHLDNPIFDLMNFTEFFSYKACRIPIDNATVMAGCLKDKTCEPLAANIEAQFKKIVSDTNATKDGGFFILYSGHGIRKAGGNEADGMEEDLVGEDMQFVKDTMIFNELGQALEPGHWGVIILDACHSGGQNWPYVVSASDMKVQKNDENQCENNGDLSGRGWTKVFMTSSKLQTSADGLVGQGGAGSQALRYAFVKHGMSVTNQQVLETTRDWLKAHGFDQTPSIQTSHPMELSDTFLPKEAIAKIAQLERSVHPVARDLQEHEDIRPEWQKPYVHQQKVAKTWRQHAKKLQELAALERELAALGVK